MPRRRWIGLVVLGQLGTLCLLGTVGLLGGHARAEPPQAEEPAAASAPAFFDEGSAAFARGDFVAAGRSFERAFELDPRPESLWNAARSWHRAGEQARAANLYTRYVDEAPSGAADRDEALRSLLELRAELGRLQIVARGAGAVEVDGQRAREGTWYVLPGLHRVEASFEGASVEREAAVARGEALTVLLTAPAAPVATRPDPATSTPENQPSTRVPVPVPEPRSGLQPWLLAPLFSVTALAGGLTVASGIDTLVARDDYLAIPERERTGDLFAQGKFKQDRTNVLIGVSAGLAVISVGVALFAVDWGSDVAVGLGPGSIEGRVHF